MAASTKSKGKKKELIKGPQTEVTTEVLDFIKALDDYKKSKNRPFPTWSEVLEVLKQLGYRQVEDARPIEEIGEKPQASTRPAKSPPKKAAKKAVKKAAKKSSKKATRKSSKK